MIATDGQGLAIRKSVLCDNKSYYCLNVLKLAPSYFYSCGNYCTLKQVSKMHIICTNHYSARLQCQCAHYHSCTSQTLKKNK